MVVVPMIINNNNSPLATASFLKVRRQHCMAINEKSAIHLIVDNQWALNKLTKHEIEQEYLCGYLNANEALTRKEKITVGPHIDGEDSRSEQQT